MPEYDTTARHRMVRAIAQRADLNEKAINRLLARSPIRLESGTTYALGLSLGTAAENAAVLTSPDTIARAIMEYRRLCPLVVAWLGRGDFNPKKIPEDLDGAKLLHACRTAQRLRACLFRETSKATKSGSRDGARGP